MKRLLTLSIAGLFLFGMVGMASAASFGTWVDATAGDTSSGEGVDQEIDSPSATSGSAQAATVVNSATAKASCDISGSLRVFASATGNNAYAVATANFYDTLTYTAPVGFVGSFLPVTYNLHVSGSVSGNSPYNSTHWFGKIEDASHGAFVMYNTDPGMNPGHVAGLSDFWVTLNLRLPVVNGRLRIN